MIHNEHTPPLSTVIAANIRRSRTARNITQKEIAALTGLTQGYISRVERGKRSLSVDKLQRFSQALDVPIHELTASA
jgi:transcriptional regulator with XRE-family HTH domain